MSKSQKKKRDFSSDSEVANRPFAALGGLRDALPAGKSFDGGTSVANHSNQDAAVGDWKSESIVLQREKKGRGGKTIVRIKGLTLTPDELTDLLKKIKSDLGCGGTIENGDALILGDVSERLLTWFGKNGARRVKRGN